MFFCSFGEKYDKFGCLFISGTKGTQGDWKFSAKAGYLNLAFHSRLLCVSVMDMAALALFSLKVVCHNCMP